MRKTKKASPRRGAPRKARQLPNLAAGFVVLDGHKVSIPQEMTRLSDQVFARLLDAVTRCVLRPGSVVTEAQLEEATGYGRVPLRVAIDRLAQMKLVQPLHRRGYRIAPLTLRDVRNTFGLRAIVEPPTARMAVGKVDIAKLRSINSRCAGRVDPKDANAVAQFVEANREFHLVIARASKNERLTDLIELLLKDIERFYYFGLMSDRRLPGMQDEHLQLIAAIEDGDGDEAEKLARQHIEIGQQVVIDAIMRDSELADTELTLKIT